FSLVKNNESPFITTWQTTTANESITIPTFSDETYDYIIDWGDGSIAYGVTGDASHTYTTAGTYTVSIFGTFPRIFFDGSTSNNAEKLLTVEQWGDNPWTSMEGAFHRCANLTITNANIDIPDLSNVISFVEIFDGCISFNSDISNWDVSNVEDFSEAFEDCDIFNQPLNSWDMSSAQSISYMFYEAFAFNQPLNNWNVSNVTNMEGVFASASVFNQDLNSWNVSNVTSMYEMFDTANAFNGNISSWNVANVQNMEDLFQDNLVFNQNISGWNVSSVEDMTAMFSGAEAFNQDISGWNVGAVTQMNDMFQNAILFNQDIGNWNVSSVTNMYEMFDGADSFDQNLGNWDIGNIMDTGFSNSGLRGMFGSGPGGVAMSVANYDATLIGWNTDNSGIAGDGIDDIPQNLIFGGGKNQYCTSEADQLNLINTHGWSISDDGQASDCGILIAPKVYLQGATLNPNTGEETLMRDDLRVNGLLSTTSPYADSATCEATVFDTTGADAIVDWIWIELRDATDNTSAFASQSALLQRDGDVVSVDGSTAVEFNVESRNYYVVIKHRNHLGIMSASSIALSATETIVDFRDGSTVTFGSNAQTSFGMPSGVVGMGAGNVNDDTLVQYSGTSPDTPNILSLVLNDPGNFLNFPTFAVSGYDNNDVNMDGSTQYSGTNPDSPVILQNVLAHPGNFLNFSTYQIIEQLPQD
ncbi:MAG: BspA family leucine-rich repeat surface protein, partial [Bacteroidota bacterium]